MYTYIKLKFINNFLFKKEIRLNVTFFTRCILELYSIASSGGHFHVALNPRERARYVESTKSNPGAFNNMLSLVNSKRAQCSREPDRVRGRFIYQIIHVSELKFALRFASWRVLNET